MEPGVNGPVANRGYDPSMKKSLFARATDALADYAVAAVVAMALTALARREARREMRLSPS